MELMKKIILPVVFTLISITVLVCQNKDNNPQFWISSGIGQVHSGAFEKIGMAGGMGFHVKAKQHYFSAQVNQFWELPQEGRVNSEINEMKLQYGWIKSFQRQDLFIAAGISTNSYDYITTNFNRENGKNYEERVVTSNNSFVLESGINWKLSKYFGIGVNAMGSFNNTAVIGGYRINLLFGLFK